MGRQSFESNKTLVGSDLYLGIPRNHLERTKDRDLHRILQNWTVPENMYTPPPPALWTTLNWVPRNFRISKKDTNSLFRIQNPADSKSSGIPEFCKVLNRFAGIPIKIHKMSGKFTEFQSFSPSIYYRISNVVHV